MLPTFRILAVTATLAGGLFLCSAAPADEPTPPAQSQTKDDIPRVSLLDAMRDGSVAVSAEGIGDGRMTLSITNRTPRQLRVLLPPGLIATGATGQFGGMGGGMGGMGGGMMG